MDAWQRTGAALDGHLIARVGTVGRGDLTAAVGDHLIAEPDPASRLPRVGSRVAPGQRSRGLNPRHRGARQGERCDGDDLGNPPIDEIFGSVTGWPSARISRSTWQRAHGQDLATRLVPDPAAAVKPAVGFGVNAARILTFDAGRVARQGVTFQAARRTLRPI